MGRVLNAVYSGIRPWPALRPTLAPTPDPVSDGGTSPHVPSQEATMKKLPRNPTATGPAETFTGSVLVDGIRGPMDGSRVAMAHVHFAPGARTYWHTHPVGQTLYGTDGIGVVVSRDGTVVTLEPGRTVWIPPHEEHWHGALDDQLMAHIAIQEGDDADETVTWLDPVGDEEFARANEAARGR